MDDDKGENWEEDYKEQGEWNDHEHHEKEEVTEGGKNKLMFGKDSLEVRMHRGCLNDLNRMELSNDTRVAFLEDIFHKMGTNDLRRTNCDTLELIPFSFLLELQWDPKCVTIQHLAQCHNLPCHWKTYEIFVSNFQFEDKHFHNAHHISWTHHWLS
jgi:hypothetical protein